MQAPTRADYVRVYFTMMSVHRITAFETQHHWLMQHLQLAIPLGSEQILHRITLSRRYKTLHPILQAFIAFVGCWAEALYPEFESRVLIEDILRGEWNFQGHFVSDCGALSDFHLHHKVTEDAADSAALALQRGCNLGCDHVFNEIPEAINRGDITDAHVDRALERTLGTRFKLGMLDPVEVVPFASISTDVVACDEHRQAIQTQPRSPSFI